MGAIFDALNTEPVRSSLDRTLLAYHGMRSGEACQLRCEDVTVFMAYLCCVFMICTAR